MSQCTAAHVRTALLGVLFAVPVGCVVAPVHSDNGIAIDPVTGACTAPQYTPKAYQTGDQVQNAGKLYQCSVGGWCSIGGPYEPGVGWAWQQAWNELATCSSGSSGSTTSTGSGSGGSTGTTSGSGTGGTGGTGGSSGSGGSGGSAGSGGSSNATYLQSFSTWYCGDSCGSNDLSSCGLSYCENTIAPNVLGAALSIKRMNGPSGVWKGGGLCGKHVEIVVQATGKSITVPVLDACQACDADDHVDLTLGVWEQLGINTCDGRFAQKWRIVD